MPAGPVPQSTSCSTRDLVRAHPSPYLFSCTSLSNFVRNVRQRIRGSPQRTMKKEKTTKPNFLDTLLDESIQASMEKPLFKLVQGWLLAQTGGHIDVAYLTWAITAYIPANLYAGETIAWLCDSFTNTVRLTLSETLTTDLQVWISKQPSNHLLHWLPNSEHLERKGRSVTPETDSWATLGIANNKNDNNGNHAMVSSAGFAPYFFPVSYTHLTLPTKRIV